MSPLPPITALNADEEGVIAVIGTAAGSVPATATLIGGIAVAPDGSLYVVFV